MHVLKAILCEHRREHFEFLRPTKVLFHRAIPLSLHSSEAAAELGVMKKPVQGEHIPWIAAALMADLQQLSGFAHGLHHRTRTFNRVAHHLFAVNMKTGFEAGVGHRRMPEIGRGDKNRLQILFLREQIFVILVGANLVAELLQIALAFPAVVVPDVTKGHQPDTLNIEQGFEEDLALLAIADKSDVDGVQGRLFNRGGLFAGVGLAGLQQHRGARQGRSSNKVTTIQLIYHFLSTANLLCWTSKNAAATRPM